MKKKLDFDLLLYFAGQCLVIYCAGWVANDIFAAALVAITAISCFVAGRLSA